MDEITTLGIDLAKSVFQLHGVDAEGRAVLRRQLRRSQMGEGRKSLAISVRLQPTDRTLTEAEIEALSAKVIDKVTKATGGVLRA